jgi:hypothetical protein
MGIKDFFKIWGAYTLLLIGWSIVIMVISSIYYPMEGGHIAALLLFGYGLISLFMGRKFYKKLARPWKSMGHANHRILIRFYAIGVICTGFSIFALIDLLLSR